MQKLLKVALRPLVLTAVLAVTEICFGTHAQAISRSSISDTPITVNFQGKLLRDALDEIRQKSGLGIIYNDGDLPENFRVSYKTQNAPVKDVLQQLLKDTRLTFKEHKGNIVIYIREQATEKRTTGSGSLQGNLTDAETGEPLIGATVLLIGTALGGSTNAEGRYAVNNVPEGIYDLGVSYIGYETGIVRGIKILPGQITTIDHKLKISATQLQDIEIIGDKALSGNVVETNEVSMVNEIKASSLIITGISAQQIARSVDQDAAQVARRLPGVAVLNNFVNIRGMHERYNLTYLNGMVAPSSETDTRAFSYDLLPSGMIDKMTVYRSPAPELLADWAGGVIKIETKNTSIARQIEVNFSTWYRPGSSGDDYYTYSGGKRDWLAQDDGTRALPDGFPAQGQIPPPGTAENSTWGSRMYNKWSLQKARYGLDYRGGINYYDAWKLGKMRLSNLTSLSTTQAMQVIHQDFVPKEEGYDKEGYLLLGRHFKDTVSQVQARWSAVQNLTLHINPRHRIEAKGLFNQLATDETLVRDGFDALGGDLGQYGYQTRIIYTYRSRSVLATQLAGNHSMGENDRHNIQWAAGYGYSKDDIPAQRMLNLAPDISQYDDPHAKRYIHGGDPTSFMNGHYNTHAREKNYTISLDYTGKLAGGAFVKAGAFNEVKERDQDARFIRFNGMPARDEAGNPFTQWNADEMYSAAQYGEDGSGIDITDGGLAGLFNVRANLIGVYAAVNIPLFNKKLNIYGGVRYEGQDLFLTEPGQPGEEDLVDTDRYLYYWLPSVNVSWNLTDKVLLRGAYGKTLNRPNFREMMPFGVRDFRLDRTFLGDSSLMDAEIHNFDLRLEYYPAEGEFISAGAFYKNLSNAIEPYVEVFGQSERIFFNNTPESVVYGAEVEVRKSLNMLPWRWAQRFSVISNLALLKSEVKFQDNLFGKLTEDFRIFSRPLEGTASYVVNAGLYYDHETSGTKVSLLYNVLGQRLILAPTKDFPAYYEMPRHALDISVRQRITKYMELRAGVQDVLNQAVRRYADYDRNEYWSRNERSKWPYKDWMFQRFKPGSYFTLGLNVTL
jgi:outer membrane receptor protein involved in Fe transport